MPMTPDPKSIESLRREIDEIDDAVHDLIIRRTGVVEQIAKLKGNGGTFLRPAREAMILRRLAGRHSGTLPISVLVRVWRELIAGFTRIQGPFVVATVATDENRVLWDVARDHYGSTTPITACGAPLQAIRAVIDGTATIAVVPWPDSDDPDPWWPALLNEDARVPRIVARLPFMQVGEIPNERMALALARLPHEPTGEDHTLVNLGFRQPLSRGKLREALTACGLEPVAFWSSIATDDDQHVLQLVEVAGFVAPDDGRLATLVERFSDIEAWAVPLGGFALPIRQPARRKRG